MGTFALRREEEGPCRKNLGVKNSGTVGVLAWPDDACENKGRPGRVNLRLPLVVGESGRRGEVCFEGEISNRRETVAKMIDRLGAKHGKLASFYEAGSCVFGLHRQTIMMARDWVIVAESLVLTRPGDLPTISLNNPG